MGCRWSEMTSQWEAEHLGSLGQTGGNEFPTLVVRSRGTIQFGFLYLLGQ